MMKSSTLKRIYKRYNRTYFDNQLPFEAIIVFRDIGADVDGLASPWAWEIELNKDLNSLNEIHGSLLHEMIHFWQYFVEDKDLEDEKEHHDIEFYFQALQLYQLTGYPIA